MSFPQSLIKLIGSTGSKQLFEIKFHGAEKRKRCPLGFFIIQFVAEIKNNQRGDPSMTSKKFGKKVSQCQKKQ